MKQKEEKWALFWCDLLHPVLFDEVEPGQVQAYLKEISETETVFPGGRTGKPSLSTLRRKLKRYRKGGFGALARKLRKDRGHARAVPSEVIETAIELKKEQPRRSHAAINRFLKDIHGDMLCRSTLYRHLKDAGATRLKLGVVRQKVRKRWTRDHTHDLWVGDFEEGPYVLVGAEVLPTYLCAFIDCFSRYVVEARYYLRQSLDILIDSLLRALAKHGAPSELYVDNAKVYHSDGLKAACYRLNIRLRYRPAKDPSPGGLIERFFGTAQDQFEAEVRAQDAMSLDDLNRALSAWLCVGYHQSIHSESGQAPKDRYDAGLTVIRSVEMDQVLASFMRKVTRVVHKDFSDISLDKRLYRVDPKLRGDKVWVHYDPFSCLDTVQIKSLKGLYLGKGVLHHRENTQAPTPAQPSGKPKHNFIDLLVREHQQQLAASTQGIDYRKVVSGRSWPFHAFAKALARLLGRDEGISAFAAQELETLKKFYNQNLQLSEPALTEAFCRAQDKSLPCLIHELKQILRKKE
ncbi:MAG: DDE-type integrase/transposase/recombinase [Phycisphaerae bacterium]